MKEEVYFSRNEKRLQNQKGALCEKKGVPYDHSNDNLPGEYRCSECGMNGGKLWYEEQSGKLFCKNCQKRHFLKKFFRAIPALWNGEGKLLFHSRGVCLQKEVEWWEALPETCFFESKEGSAVA